MGLEPDGDRALTPAESERRHRCRGSGLGAVDWTLARAIRTTRFWWIALGYFTGLLWYAVQVHQTKYLIEIGFKPGLCRVGLGFVSLAGIPGQIGLGYLSDRIGRELVWAVGGWDSSSATSRSSHARSPTPALLYLMVLAQGVLGYVSPPSSAPFPRNLPGKHYGTVFGTLMLAAVGGGAVGPWLTGALHDATGSYTLAFSIAIGMSALSAVAIWRAAPAQGPGRRGPRASPSLTLMEGS